MIILHFAETKNQPLSENVFFQKYNLLLFTSGIPQKYRPLFWFLIIVTTSKNN